MPVFASAPFSWLRIVSRETPRTCAISCNDCPLATPRATLASAELREKRPDRRSAVGAFGSVTGVAKSTKLALPKMSCAERSTGRRCRTNAGLSSSAGTGIDIGSSMLPSRLRVRSSRRAVGWCITLSLSKAPTATRGASVSSRELANVLSLSLRGDL